jgi:hypothetical protein
VGRYEFKIVVSDVDLSETHQKKIGQAIAQAGAMAIAESTSGEPVVSVPLGLNKLWLGRPAPKILHELEAFAHSEAGAIEGG